MKRKLLSILLVLLSTKRLMAQGIINANNAGTGVYITIQDVSGVINGGQLARIGTPATAAGFIGAGPGQVAMSLYAAPIGTSLQTLESTTPVWTGFNVTGTVSLAQGWVSPGSPFTLPTRPGLDASVQIEVIFQANATINGTPWTWWSDEGTVQPITQAQESMGTAPTPVIWGTSATTPDGILSMAMGIPEPSPFVLCGVGFGTLLWFRRLRNGCRI